MMDSTLLQVIAGGLLLAFGRRLYWFFVGVVGFFLGFFLAQNFLSTASESTTLLIGLGVGLVGALLVVFFKKVAIGVVGFVAGVLVVLWLAGEVGWETGVWVWLGAAVVGVIGALATRTLFEVALVVLSSLIGAVLVSEVVSWELLPPGVLFLILALTGVALQTLMTWGGDRED
jgi:hypothetical protein